MSLTTKVRDKTTDEIWLTAASFELSATEGSKPKFSMTAYTGGAMVVAGFDHPVVIDYSRLEKSGNHIPVRLDHNPHQGVGHTTRIEVERGFLNAEGVISRDNGFARDVAASGLAGFPWRASVGGKILDAKFYPKRQNVNANGREFEGPLYVVAMRLKEISFVDQGADEETTAQIHANANERKTNMDEKEKNANTEEKTLEASAPQKEKNSEALEVDVLNSDALVRKTMDRINAEAAENLTRIQRIRDVGKGLYPELEAEAIRDNWTADRFELDMLRRGTTRQAPAIHAAADTATRDVLVCAACATAGMRSERREKLFPEKTLDAADRYTGIGLQDFAELVCGQRLPSLRRDGRAWLTAAFSTNGLSDILSNVANKILLEGYNYVEDAWRRICKIGSVNDFKESERYRMTSALEFKQLGPGGQIQHGTVGEQKFGQKIDTYAVSFGFDRKMMYDDDLGALLDLNRQFGVSAGESVAATVWTNFLANPTQSDSKTFYHSGHHNKFTGADTALSFSALSAAEKNYMALKKPNGHPLGITPAIMLVPYDLGGIADTLTKSQTLNDGTTAPTGTANIHYGKFEVVKSAYLSNSTIHMNASATAWYLLADPNRLPAYEVAFLGGKDSPTIESAEADFDTLGIRFRAYIDYGFREQDWRGAIQMAGA